MSDDVGSFGARLRACRQSAGLSQQDLAERSGLSIRAIGDLERGRTRWPYQNSLHRLADALGLHDGARADFVAAGGRRLAGPPPAAGSGAPGRKPRGRLVPRFLPTAVPAFVGRQEQLTALTQVLHRPGGTAVITAIGGTAGVGKTALAVYWAQQVTGEFPDGQLFVNLRGFDPSLPPVTPADAVRVLLDALQVPADRLPQTVEGQLGLYRSLLAGQRMLVVLDNARDVAQVRPLLPGSPTCRVIVTSRNQLTGLAVIEAARPLTLDVLTDLEAHELLENRLGASRLAADPAATAQIITSCAHLPLALCIIAARTAMRPDLPLAQVAADLGGNRGLDAFAGGDDPAADVRDVFSWSYRQLDPDAARIFRLAGLHPGPDLELHAVAALAAAPVPQAGDLLDVLARAGMIQAAGPGRYGMHDLLRGYARELAASHDSEDEQRAALTGLADYYLQAAATAMDTAFPAERHRRPRVAGPGTPAPALSTPATALAWLATELPSLVAIVAHTAEHGWPRHATLLSATLFRYLDSAGRFPEAIALHGHACRAAHDSGDRAAEASALVCLGLVDGHQGRLQQAISHFERALALAREVGDQDTEARALNYRGLSLLQQGHPDLATSDIERAVLLFRAVGERTGEAYALSNLGVVHRWQGRYQQAADSQQQALALLRAQGDRPGEASVLDRIGLIDLARGDYQQASSHHQQALALYRETGDRMGQASAMARLGLACHGQGRYEQAARHLQRALTLNEEISDLVGQAGTRNGLGAALLAIGRPADARTQHSAALKLAGQAGNQYEQARAHDGLASSYQASGGPAKARRHWQQALALYIDLGSPEADQIRAKLAQATTAAASL
jgi:tetratricopeptide (TPR) repeat protein/DNA-binding XRE family transcriptional regulator